MTEWTLAQQKPEDELARLHHFSVKKQQDGKEIEFVITIYEFAHPKEPHLAFFARTDKQTNQKTAPFTPSGWGTSLEKALQECVAALHRFPYEGADLE